MHTWGLNVESALGRASAQLNAPPAPIAALPPMRSVALGQGFMLALAQDGALYAWGDNAAGQIGAGASAERRRRRKRSSRARVSTR